MPAASSSTNVGYGLADLEDLDAVRAFAREFRATMTGSTCSSRTQASSTRRSARDGAGTELTILGQVAAPFLPTTLLMPTLLASAPYQVITVSSDGMYTERLDLATLQLPASAVPGRHRYARAERARSR